MKMSCGVLIINDKKQILMGHVTGQKHFDIPKGLLEENEDKQTCAIRECLEETGIKFTEGELKEIGTFDYNKSKKLTLFLSFMSDFDLSELVCNSYFEHHYTKQRLPEVDYFKWVSANEVVSHCAPSMVTLLTEKVLPSLSIDIEPKLNSIPTL